MLKKILLSGTVLAAAFPISSAIAADLPAYEAPPVPAPPIFSWTGFYGGINAGFGGGVIDGDLNLSQPPLVAGGALLSPGFLSTIHLSDRTAGPIAGGQLGYNFQFANNFVLGLESDAQWSGVQFREHERAIGFPVGTVRATDLHAGLDWFGTTRLRAGYALGRFLPYLTAGVAYGEVSLSGFENIVGLGPRTSVGAASTTHVGWAAGAGAEFVVSNFLSAKAEYLYAQFDGVTAPAAALVPPPLPAFGSSTTGSFGTHIIRAGLNWKLGGFGLAPDIAGPIGAADLPSRKAPPADLAPAPAFPWTGFYVGANGGYGGGVVDADLNLGQPPVILGGALLSPGFLAALHTSNRTGGLIAGGQVGYNFQFANNVVLGLESDAQWSDIKQGQHEKAASTLILVPIASARTTDQQFGLDWFGTTRLRAGYALGRFLPYVTGGVAYGRVSASGFQNIMGSGPGLFGSSASATHVGWTAGAGAEYAFTDRLSLKGEYLFTEFNGVSGPILALAPPPIPAIGSFSTGTFGSHLVRAGVNWRFGAIAGSY